MILYYALGGGLGHLTRGRRVLAALGLDATFVTASPYADDPRVTGGHPVIRVPAELEHDVDAHRAWLRDLACERLIVDTFPCGIQGELCGLDVPMDLVARRLRWDEYRRACPGPLPRFGTAWRMEELEPAHESALLSAAANVGRGFSPPSPGVSGLKPRPTFNYWLIVHSGPEDEVRELVAYTEELRRVAASDERVLVATRCRVELPAGYEAIDAYPVAHLFENATRIISAAGFNVMSETEPWRDKHHAVPFPRRFDDQFARLSSAKLRPPLRSP